MAKAVANCTCTKCGKQFTREAIKRNRADADSWASWAENNFTLCGACYAAEQREAEKAKGLVADIVIDTARAMQDGAISYIIVAGGDSYAHKDDLKAAGYRYEARPARGVLGDLLATRDPGKAWCKHFQEADLEEIKNEFEALGGQIVKIPDEASFALASYLAADAAEKNAEKQAAVDAVTATRPSRPACLPNGKWNGTVYGKSGNRAVYINGDKINLTDAEASEVEAYEKAMSDYNARLADVKRKNMCK